MTIQEALDQRIPRVRKPVWANPQAYLRLPLRPGGAIGPWAELYDDLCQAEVIQVRPGSQRLCPMLPEIAGDDGYERYTGPVSPFEQDKQNLARNYLEY